MPDTLMRQLALTGDEDRNPGVASGAAARRNAADHRRRIGQSRSTMLQQA